MQALTTGMTAGSGKEAFLCRRGDAKMQRCRSFGPVCAVLQKLNKRFGKLGRGGERAQTSLLLFHLKSPDAHGKQGSTAPCRQL